MNPIHRILHRITVLNDDLLSRTTQFVNSQQLSHLAEKFETNLKKRNVDVGFNLFSIISDVYYRENLHSDILTAFLDPNGKHQEKDKFLRAFLEFLQKRQVKIQASNYLNAHVLREEGRIDILIADEKSQRAIIVENKINDAPDMLRQLPRYLEHVKSMNYSCDAIIYLRLNGNSGPDTTRWTADDRSQVMPILHVVCAYDDSENDLLNGWILKCKSLAINPEAQHILRQYGDIIKKLGGNIMNKPIMEEFYKVICEGNNLKTALSLKAMLDDLVQFRVEKIITTFKSDLTPFGKIANYNNYDAYFTGLFWKEAHLGLDVWVLPESYALTFWDRNDDLGKKGYARTVIEKMGCLDEFKFDGKFTKKVEFAFPSQEAKLIDYISGFKRKLSEAIVGMDSTGV